MYNRQHFRTSERSNLGSVVGAFVRPRCEIGSGFEVQQDHLRSSVRLFPACKEK